MTKLLLSIILSIALISMIVSVDATTWDEFKEEDKASDTSKAAFWISGNKVNHEQSFNLSDIDGTVYDDAMGNKALYEYYLVLDEDITELNYTIETLQSEVYDLESDYDDLQTEYDDLESRVTELEKPWYERLFDWFN